MIRLSHSFLIRSSIVAASSAPSQLACLLPRLTLYEVSRKVAPVRAMSSQIASHMKAVRVDEFGDESKLKVVTQPVPQPKEKEVLLKVEAVGVNPVEAMIRQGMFGDMVKTPYVPGSDAAGIVEKVGPGVRKFKKGDRVYTISASSGAYAEYCVAPVDSVSDLNSSLTFSQGAALGLPYTAAYKALFIRAEACKGEVVFIHGASGSVGLAAVQLAKAHGLRVIASAGSQEGCDLVRCQGADAVVNHREEGYIDKVKQAAGSDGVSVVLEMLADKNLVSDLDLVNRRARIVFIGMKGMIPEFNASPLMGKEASIMGMVVQTSTPAEYQEMLKVINQGQGQWVNPPIAKEFPLTQVADAHRDMARAKDSKGKLVLKP